MDDCVETSIDLVQSSPGGLRLTPENLDTQRQLGAFYTCPSTAEFMADWAIRAPAHRVLEPSFGSGIFLRAARRVAERKYRNNIRLLGAELAPEEFKQAKVNFFTDGDVAYLGDFFNMPISEVDAVIGNPPYVRLRHLPVEQARSAYESANLDLGHPMDTSGSVWMPFVLRCMRFLKKDGRMALVLPFELTYVKYARPLWRALARRFSNLTVIRVRERIFPDILQDVVILFADGHGGSTESIVLRLHNTLAQLLEQRPLKEATVAIDSIANGNRGFLRAHLSQPLQALLDNKILPETRPISDTCAFNIGYVCGHKHYFHPSAEDKSKWKLPERSLVGSIVSGRKMSGGGLYTSALDSEDAGQLFLPDPSRLTKGEQAYIAHGESVAVHTRYKCRVRTPWYVVPGVKVPDLILSVFSERPILMVNDAGLTSTNSLLTGFLKPGIDREAFVATWYTSLTLLSCEMEVHSLGGGVLVLIPGEAGKIRLPELQRPTRAHLKKLDNALRRGDLSQAYALGDEFVLKRAMGLSESEIATIQQGVAHLTSWRTAARSTI